MNISKYIFSLLLVTAYTVSADNVKPGEETGEFHYFNVTNPAGFVNAIDEHYASDCAKKWQSESGAEVVLMGVLGSVHTHFIYVGYKNNDMLEKGRSIVTSCPETAELIRKLSKHSEPSDYLQSSHQLLGTAHQVYSHNHLVQNALIAFLLIQLFQDKM